MKSMEWIKIEDLDIYISDGNYSSKYPRSSEFVSSGIPFIRANNFLNKTIAPKEMYFITPEKHQALLKGYVKTGDVLITTRGDLGKTALVPESYNDANINAQIVLLRANSQQIEPKFLIWCFDIPEVKFQITQLQTGTALQQLPVGKLIKIKLPLPPIAEQKRIAEILDHTQSLISKRKEAIAKLDTLSQSIFIEMFGDPATNPKEWDKKFIKDIGQVITGNTPSRANPEFYGDAIEWIKSDNINTPLDYLTQAEESLSELGKSVSRIAPSGSILVTCIAGTPSCIGNAAIANRDVAFNQQINALVPFTHNVKFIYTQILVAKKLIQEASTASMKGMVSKSRFEEIRFICPPLPLQQKFAQRVEAVEKLKATHRASLSELQALFASLQHRAFRGEL